MTEQKRKTFTVYLPTGPIYIDADCVTKGEEKNEIIFYIKKKEEGYVNYMLLPVAQFNLYNIYGWSENNA